ncbi:MAG: YraN family protein [Anaerolineales bacterium]|nr:YraN family protein [Anaerolineales bacterium]
MPDHPAGKGAVVTTGNRQLGNRGEETAADHLSKSGYEILKRNVRTPYGELDLITRQAGSTVFIEVKTRRSRTHGLPEEAVTPRKRSHLLASAQYFLQQHALSDSPWRIDVVAVELDSSGTLKRLEVFENAVHA